MDFHTALDWVECHIIARGDVETMIEPCGCVWKNGEKTKECS